MKSTYYKDSLKSYMIIPCPPEAQTRGYQYRMLGMNRIGGLLPCSLRHIDGTGYLYYDITGKQSMEGLYEERKIPGAEFFKLLEAAVRVSGALSEYLLDEQYLILSEEQVFYDLGSGSYSFAYYPGEVMKPEIFRFLADRIDGTDKMAAAAAYRLCSIAEGDRQALREAVKEEAEQKDIPDPWEKWKKEKTAEEGQSPFRREESDVRKETGSKEEEREISADKKADRNSPLKDRKRDPEGERERPLYTKMQLAIRISLIVMLLAGAGALTAVQIMVYITQREKRLCIAGAVLLLIAAVLLTAEMIVRICRERKKKKDESAGKEVYSESDEKDLPVFGAAIGEDYRLCEGEGNTIRLSEHEVAGRLYGRDRGNRIDLRTLPLTVGKAQAFSDVVLPDPSISRVHARIYKCEDGGIEIRDLDSTNGTFVNGVRIGPDERARVRRGDEVRFGNVEYEYR